MCDNGFNDRKRLNKMVKIRLIVFTILLIYLLTACGAAATPAAPATAAPATAAPATAVPATAVAATATIQPISTLTIEEQFAKIDALLRQNIDASIAYNTPNTMLLDGTVTIELLMNPSLSNQQLRSQVTGSGPVTTATIEITPRMRANLLAADENAITIRPIQVNSEQIISGTETTKWSWMVTAKKAGLQTLTLTIYRLVHYEDQDYWHEVKAYQTQIKVIVTLPQWFKSVDWKWYAGFLLALVGCVLGILTYMNSRKENAEEEKPVQISKK
jgi:hypothetical protein